MDEKKFFSSGRALILEFHTDPNSMESHSGFKGVFTFLEKSSFKTDGILQYGTQCTYDIQSTYNHTSGKFFSPRYPQKYPQSSNCRYIFMGQESEKVKVIFRIIRLPKHISSCDNSEDVIKVYDGANDSAKLIKQFCDTHNHEEIYSSGPYMYVEFMSDDFHEKQGFAAEFQFVNLLLKCKCTSKKETKSNNLQITQIQCKPMYLVDPKLVLYYTTEDDNPSNTDT
ncbi:DMBT1-like protein, partial [Mya arenaria]